MILSWFSLFFSLLYSESQLPFVIEEEFKYVTCGSSVKLTNKENGFKLHSHSVSYGNSGSGQQSVTGFEHSNDANSYFIVREGFKETPCTLGEPIKCNSIIRLYHTSTKMYLHSHQGFNSPLSGRQEVSAFDKMDNGDNWKLICQDEIKFWKRETEVMLEHVDTGNYLSCTKNYMYQSVIPGQLEVTCVNSKSNSEKWLAQEGIYFGN